MAEKRIAVQWQTNEHDSEDNSWQFGYLTAAEFAILTSSRTIQFDGKAYNVGVMLESTWDKDGLVSATIPLYRAS